MSNPKDLTFLLRKGGQMKKIKVLEVNNIDLIGNRFNGYDMIEEIQDETFEIKQAVVTKQSDNKNVINILNHSSQYECYNKFESFEENNSIKNVFSITTPALMSLKEYKEADIIHFHMFHNTKLSLYSIRKIAEEKKVILSLHDPWFVTGRCVHFYDCDKWKKGCHNCPSLNNLFSFKEDNCSSMWNLKKQILNCSNINLVVATKWSEELVKSSPITNKQKYVYNIPFGIDYKKFRQVSNKEAREHYNIPKDHIVLFLRAQNEFKGTPYVLDALKKLKTKEKITVLTCDNKNLLDEVKDKYNVIDLGSIKDKEMINAMNACDIFLMPSIGESFGLMAIEAMACSKPVVVFDNSALPTVTDAPNCGYLVKNRDSYDLMKAIKILVENKNERLKRGKLGYEKVLKEYTNEEYNKKIKKMYLEVHERKQEQQNINVAEDIHNIEQLKYVLNEMTVMLFGTSSEYAKQLMYQNISEKQIANYKIKYDNLKTQEFLYNYLNELNKFLVMQETLNNSKKIKLEKLIYLLKKNPTRLIKKIINKR